VLRLKSFSLFSNSGRYLACEKFQFALKVVVSGINHPQITIMSFKSFSKQIFILLFFFISTSALHSQSVSLTATAGTTSSTYSTLKAAFDAINSGTHTGSITILLAGNITETATAQLNASGSLSANYTSVSITPSGNVKITGNLNSSLIYLYGADNVTINGLNANGNSLTIENSNTSTSTTSPSSLLFANNANNNVITNCFIKGSSNNTQSTYSTGVVTFDGASNNTISFSEIGPAGSNKPWACIVASGGTNNNNIINQCKLFDFFLTGTEANQAGIYLKAGATAWTITNNSIYQTAAVAATGGRMVGIYMGSGNGHVISNNFFGGSAPSCQGAQMTYTGSLRSMRFLETSLSIGNAVVNTITNNTIANINILSTENSTATTLHNRFAAFFIQSGKHSIKNNTVGSMTSTDNIVLNNGNINSPYRILHASGNTGRSTDLILEAFNNNQMGGITVNTGSGAEVKFIYSNTTAGCQIDSISNNIFGSAAFTNSINISAANNVSRMIELQGTSNTNATLISGNTFQNISIGGSQGMNVIYSNEISNVTNNIIQNITGTNTVQYTISGISLASTLTSPCTIKNNFISNLASSSSTGSIYGIYANTQTITAIHTISNNIIQIGNGDLAGNSIVGIYAHTGNIYFNTVSLGGTNNSGTGETYAFRRGSSSVPLDLRNNIFYNVRSNSSGPTPKHYSIYLAGTTSCTTDYNDYFVSTSNGATPTLGKINTTDHPSIESWRSGTSQDVNSISIDPGFASAGGNSPLGYIPAASLTATIGTGITTDYSGRPRNSTTPVMGALEYSKVWNGGTDSDWGNPNNWSHSSIPGPSDYVIFNSTAANSITLGLDRTVQGINFNGSNKKVVLGNYNLTIGNITGASSSQFFETNGVGRLKSTIATGNSFTFPVGVNLTVSNTTIPIYLPITLTNNSAPSEYYVTVSNGVYTDGATGGTTSGTLIANTSPRIDMTWNIGNSAGAVSSPGIDLVVNWPVAAAAIFAGTSSLTTPTLLHHNGTQWGTITGTTTYNLTTGTLTHTGYIGNFSPFAIAQSSGALPVTWLSFTAQKQGEKSFLTWSTASEQNTKDFEVQHSTNTLSWTPLGTVAAAGNSTTTRQYSFTHATPFKGSVYNYYRILQRDLDGKFSYSKIASLIYDDPGPDVFVYPNPATGTVTIYLAESQEVRLINLAGATVWKGTLAAGRNQLPLTHLAKGMYWVLTETVKKQLLVQ